VPGAWEASPSICRASAAVAIWPPSFSTRSRAFSTICALDSARTPRGYLYAIFESDAHMATGEV
jgi:hypothetical protein